MSADESIRCGTCGSWMLPETRNGEALFYCVRCNREEYVQRVVAPEIVPDGEEPLVSLTVVVACLCCGEPLEVPRIRARYPAYCAWHPQEERREARSAQLGSRYCSSCKDRPAAARGLCMRCYARWHRQCTKAGLAGVVKLGIPTQAEIDVIAARAGMSLQDRDRDRIENPEPLRKAA